MPAYIDTGLNVVDVRDTAEGHLLACERGRAGERYILGCENLTLAADLRALESYQRSRKRRGRGFRMLWRMAAGVVSTAWADLTGSEPRAPIDAVRMARKKMWVTQEKAGRELGFAPGPVGAALCAAPWSGSERTDTAEAAKTLLLRRSRNAR